MAEEEKKKKFTLPPQVQQYVDLVNTIGLPWTCVILNILYVLPFVTKMSTKVDALDVGINKVVDGLDDLNKKFENIQTLMNFKNHVANTPAPVAPEE